MAKKAIVLVWRVIITGLRAITHPRETRMALEGRLLIAANRQIGELQDEDHIARRKIAGLCDFISGAQRVFSAHAVLLGYRKRRFITVCIVLFFAVPVTSGIMTENYTVYEYSYHGRVLGVVKNVEDVQAAVRAIEGSVVEDGDKKAEIAIESIGQTEPESLPVSADGQGSAQIIQNDTGSVDLPPDVAVPVDRDQAIEIKKSFLPLTETLGRVDTEKEIVENIVSQKDLDVKAYRVSINGDTLGIVGSKEDADNVLAKITDYWLADSDRADYKEISFAENVSVDEITSTLTDIEYSDDLFGRALERVIAPKTYTVGKNETIMDVALNNGVTEQQIYAWNPDIDPDALTAGDALIMETPKAMLNVRTVEVGTYMAAIDFETIYEDTNELFLGEEQVVEPGIPGTKKAYGEIIRVDGEIVEYIEQSSEVIEEAIPEIVKRGTKPIPPSIGTGTFIVPIEGLVTSLYGPRWGRIHEGIDFGAPTGTTVRASDGGKVIAVGWDGSFGITVEIDHGAGFTTLYAHLSQTLVEEGDDVYQGQQIALSGNTGFSTGPHLHFGIYKFGNSTIPMDYLPEDMPMYLLSGIGVSSD